MDRKAFVLDDPRRLLAHLMDGGWRVIGPVERDGAIMLDLLVHPDDLPRGLAEDQGPGRYRLSPSAAGRWFDHTVSAQSWKAWLHPAKRRLWQARRAGEALAFEPTLPEWPRTAFFGPRPCDLAAIDRLVQALAPGDGLAASRRSATLIVAVNCARSAETCFCASMGTGPRAEAGYDIALTELDGRLLAEPGSDAGAALLDALALPQAASTDRAEARTVSRAAADMQRRKMPRRIAETLADTALSPRWEGIAARCLHCANCTLVCPTCFCTDVADTTDLTGESADRWQEWDSCFNPDFSYLHGGAVRQSTAARYRQWMTHKLSSWHEQFGTSGCVGCGRCITWCPVGIDITAEAAAFCEET